MMMDRIHKDWCPKAADPRNECCDCARPIQPPSIENPNPITIDMQVALMQARVDMFEKLDAYFGSPNGETAVARAILNTLKAVQRQQSGEPAR